MRIHWRVPDGSASTNGLEGRLERLKPRVRRGQGFQTVAGTRDFPQAVRYMCGSGCGRSVVC